MKFNSTSFRIIDFSIAETDEELFEDNPEEYMRRDIEGSGIDLQISIFSMFLLFCC